VDNPRVIRLGRGVYRVELTDRGELARRSELVYVAGSGRDRWAFWNGRVFREDVSARTPASGSRPDRARSQVPHSLDAPMPATVLKVLVQPGSRIKKGEAVLVLEAMKMELPIRAAADATVVAVHCKEGDLVQPEVPLVDME
jgi:biotin carboxyl carrier protein